MTPAMLSVLMTPTGNTELPNVSNSLHRPYLFAECETVQAVKISNYTFHLRILLIGNGIRYLPNPRRKKMITI